MSWAEDTYNKVKDTINDVAETAGKLKETFNDVEKMWEVITWSVNTDIVK
jgi:archaellum component FlaC